MIWLKKKQTNYLVFDNGLMLKTSASENLFGGQFTISIKLIKPNYNIL